MWSSVKNLSGNEDRVEHDIEGHVQKTLVRYKDTINYLEKYDKGEVSEPASVSKHRDLQSYIQSL